MSEISIDTTPDGVEDQLGEDLRLALLLAAQAAQRMVQTTAHRNPGGAPTPTNLGPRTGADTVPLRTAGVPSKSP